MLSKKERKLLKRIVKDAETLFVHVLHKQDDIELLKSILKKDKQDKKAIKNGFIITIGDISSKNEYCIQINKEFKNIINSLIKKMN